MQRGIKSPRELKRMNEKIKYGAMLYILGDVNGNFGLLNEFIDNNIRRDNFLREMAYRWREGGNRFSIDILQCGDFGFFSPDYDREYGARGIINNQVDFCERGRVRIFWCAGERDNHTRLCELVPRDHFDDMHEVDKGIVACDFGSWFLFADDKCALFCGGAELPPGEKRLEDSWAGELPPTWKCGDSFIKDWELPLIGDFPWWPELVVSHTAPELFGLRQRIGAAWEACGKQPSSGKLDRVFNIVRPKWWFFSHPRVNVRGTYGACRWQGLAPLGKPGCFTRLFLEKEVPLRANASS